MTSEKQHRAILQGIAQRAMLERGLLPGFSPEALTELDRIQAPAKIIDDVPDKKTCRRSWAQPIYQVYEIDPLKCPNPAELDKSLR